MPTALELGPEGWRRYAEAVVSRRSSVAKTEHEVRERERLLSLVRQVAVLLKPRFGTKKVILFGSMAHEAWFASVFSNFRVFVMGFQVFILSTEFCLLLH
jgi:hypothetical protein